MAAYIRSGNTMRIVSIVLGILGSIALFVGTLVVFLGAGMAGLAGELGSDTALKKRVANWC